MLDILAMTMAIAKDQRVEGARASQSQTNELYSRNRNRVVIYGPIELVGSLLIRRVDTDGMLLIEIIA